MVGIVLAIGVAFVVLGLVLCTDRADAWHQNRAPRVLPGRSIPPFLTSLDQCINCGRDDELLNLERRCFYCHEKHYG